MPDPHPFLQGGYSATVRLPPQMIPLKEKDKEWGEACMDGLAALGLQQYYDNRRLLENYRMLNGEFLQHQYEDTPENEHRDLIQLVQQEYDMDLKMWHFDLIGQVVNTLLGELEGHPDTLKAKAEGDTVDNARIREKGKLLKEFVDAQIEQEVQAALAEQGFDPAKSDFASEEEKQQYGEQMQQATQALTPEAIQRYISSDWKHVAEKWANITLNAAKKRYRLKQKETIEFRDSLASDKCFRHFYLTGTGFEQETWNPVDVFHSLTKDQTELEKGDYVGRTFFFTTAEVIDKFGYLLTGKELEQIYGKRNYDKAGILKDAHGNLITYTDPMGMPYGRRIPWNNSDFNSLPQVSGAGALNQDILFGQNRPELNTNLGEYQVTEGYWKSQKKVGRLRWIDPENPEAGPQTIIVDETVVLPPNTKVKEGNLYSEDDEDAVFTEAAFRPTIEWTWINQVWGGIRILPLAQPETATAGPKAIYVNVKPIPFQGKPDAFLYDAELPVVGSLFNARNARSQSLVDLLKPYQVITNLFMNQALRMAEDQILPFLSIDINTIPREKDWKDPQGFLKWYESVRSNSIAPMDLRPTNLGGANPQGNPPQVINLDISQRMSNQVNLAMTFEQMALRKVGMSSQRLGDISPQETATGIKQGAERSYVQTAPYFSRFYDYMQRCLQKTLDFSQFVQATDRDITASTINSDYSNAFLQLNGTELLTTQLSVFVSNKQQDLRNIEIGKTLALENNTILTSMAARYDMATMDDQQQIREVLKEADLQQERIRQQTQQLEQQKLETAERLQQEQQAFTAEQNRLKLESEEQQAYIRTFGGANNATTSDANEDGQFDALQYDKLNQNAQGMQQKAATDAQKTELARLKLLAENQQHQDNLSESERERASRERIAQMKIQQSRIQGDKSR